MLVAPAQPVQQLLAPAGLADSLGHGLLLCHHLLVIHQVVAKPNYTVVAALCTG
jgi:hypothetical protein